MRIIVGALVVTVGLFLASPALAAFPGANGLLAVQPVSGVGIVLVAANGRAVSRICAGKKSCGKPTRPRWSPDGRALVFAGPAIRIVYPDGSCMNCQFGAAANPVFRPGGTVISFIQGRHVTLDGIDGRREPSPPLGAATDAVWSAGGQVAVVRDGWLWVGHPSKVHRLVPGSEPSWSPSGERIVAVQRGWVVIVRVGDHHVQRLARGGAPAFSPDGRLIAYVAPDHRLMIVAADGGRSRPVRHVEARSVDWQPIPHGPNPGCVAPPGSVVLADAPDAIVTQDGPAHPPFGFEFAPPIAYMGCLPADGRERLLERFTGNNVDNASWVKSAIVAGPYAALVAHSEDEHYGGSSDEVQVFDLRSGALRTDLGGESSGCPGYVGGGCTTLDQMVLGHDGVSAAHWRTVVTVSPLQTPLEQVACAPASTVCVTVDDRLGDILTSSDPAGGRPTWASGNLFSESPPGVLSCPSQSLCVGALSDVYTSSGAADVYTSSDPAGGASTWTLSAPPGESTAAVGMSCPTVSLCVIARQDGSIATSTNPAGGAHAWAVTHIHGNDLPSAVVCSTARCFISGQNSFTSANPAGGASAWTPSRSTPAFSSGACPTTNLCVTVDAHDIATTTAPDAARWTEQPVGDQLDGVSCPSTSLCAAVGAGGALYVSTDPASGAWTRSTVDGGQGLTSISCPSTSLCVASDGIGDVVVSTNPAGGASTWIPTQLEPGPCAGATPCSIERIEVSDRSGLHAVDQSELIGSSPFLTGLTLNGDTLAWSHDGSPRTATLTPP